MNQVTIVTPILPSYTLSVYGKQTTLLSANGSTVNGTGGTYYTENVASTSETVQPNNQYLNNCGASAFVATLTALWPINSKLKIDGNALATGGWMLYCAAGQTIHFAGGTQTTTGTAGYIASSTVPDFHASSVEIRCIKANTDFLVVFSSGEIVSN